jgi:DNA-binding winged helix-turn-helix (wHTH) protein
VQIETHVDDGLPYVAGDGAAITRAVQNLIANAIRHGGHGQWVGVRAARDGECVAITIEDRGPGIDPADTAQLLLELLARIEALLRRARTLTANSADVYAFGPIEVDFRRAEVRRDREPLELSALELKLLRYLVEHRGTLLTRDELLEKVWGYDATPVTRTVDVHIASLRQKLGAEWVLTVHGLGYNFQITARSSPPPAESPRPD